jgi:hypothetical protein
MESLGSFKYGLLSSVKTNSLTFSVRVYIPVTFFSCFLVLFRNSSAILSKSGETGYPFLIVDSE